MSAIRCHGTSQVQGAMVPHTFRCGTNGTNPGGCTLKETRMIPNCPSCGQPVRPPLAVCACGHLELSHEINSKGRRTWCFHYDQSGMCRCRSYVPGGQP